MIYLDNNATTRPSMAVAAAVAAALSEFWQNPSSVHRPGQTARQQVELARRDAAALIGVPAREITFTSGGTESIDLAIRGTLRAGKGRIVVSTRVEHAAVRDLLEDLAKTGQAEVRYLPLDAEGVVNLDQAAPLLDGASLLSMQWANNETGAIQPVHAIATLCRDRGVVFHCDGTQWVGKEEVKGGVTKSRSDAVMKQDGMPTPSLRHSVTPSLPPCDILTFSPHKFHGPKGVGVLWARRGVPIKPVIHGTQELGRRGGTENVPGILGAGAACREAAAWLADESKRRQLEAVRDRFEGEVLAACPGATANGPRDRRLWNTTNIGFPRLEAEALLLLLSERGVCASAGAACSSGSLDPSPVLLAMGVPPEIAHGSLRFSLSRETTEDEVAEAAGTVAECVRRLTESLPR